jgi:hypothetical protein
MSTEVSLDQVELVERLKGISLQKQNGLLTLVREKNAIFIHFKNGEMVRAWEGNEEEIFTEALIKSKKIVQAQLETALRIQGNIKQPLVRVLLDMGYLTSEEIKGVHRLLLEEILYPLYAWKSGHFRFEAQEIAYDGDLVEPFGVSQLLAEWEYRVAKWQAILLKIPSRQIVFEVVPGVLTAPPAFEMEQMEDLERTRVLPTYVRQDDTQSKITRTVHQLQHQERPREKGPTGDWLLPLVNGQRTIQEIIEQIGIGEEDAVSSVYAGLADLLEKGYVRAQSEVSGAVSDALEATQLFSGTSKEITPDISSSFTLRKYEGIQKVRIPVEAPPEEVPVAAVRITPEKPLEEFSPTDLPAQSDEIPWSVEPETSPSTDDTHFSVNDEAGVDVAEAAVPDKVGDTARPSRLPGRIEAPAFSAAQTRFLVNGLLGLLLVGVLVLSRSFIFTSFSVPPESSQAILRLVLQNEEDILRSALALYYLEHRHFPDALHGLRHSLRTEKEQAIDLSKWDYRSDGAQFDLTRQ